ncbi:MAG: hypothetical protein ACOYZ7_03390 [Chloroflexota bacterium]
MEELQVVIAAVVCGAVAFFVPALVWTLLGAYMCQAIRGKVQEHCGEMSIGEYLRSLRKHPQDVEIVT